MEVCERCGTTYVPDTAIGQWDCWMHPGRLAAGTWTCCGFRPSACVEPQWLSTPKHRRDWDPSLPAFYEAPPLPSPSRRQVMGCRRADHGLPDNPAPVGLFPSYLITDAHRKAMVETGSLALETMDRGEFYKWVKTAPFRVHMDEPTRGLFAAWRTIATRAAIDQAFYDMLVNAWTDLVFLDMPMDANKPWIKTKKSVEALVYMISLFDDSDEDEEFDDVAVIDALNKLLKHAGNMLRHPPNGSTLDEVMHSIEIQIVHEYLLVDDDPVYTPICGGVSVIWRYAPMVDASMPEFFSPDGYRRDIIAHNLFPDLRRPHAQFIRAYGRGAVGVVGGGTKTADKHEDTDSDPSSSSSDEQGGVLSDSDTSSSDGDSDHDDTTPDDDLRVYFDDQYALTTKILRDAGDQDPATILEIGHRRITDSDDDDEQEPPLVPSRPSTPLSPPLPPPPVQSSPLLTSTQRATEMAKEAIKGVAEAKERKADAEKKQREKREKEDRKLAEEEEQRKVRHAKWEEDQSKKKKEKKKETPNGDRITISEREEELRKTMNTNAAARAAEREARLAKEREAKIEHDEHIQVEKEKARAEAKKSEKTKISIEEQRAAAQDRLDAANLAVANAKREFDDANNKYTVAWNALIEAKNRRPRDPAAIAQSQETMDEASITSEAALNSRTRAQLEQTAAQEAMSKWTKQTTLPSSPPSSSGPSGPPPQPSSSSPTPSPSVSPAKQTEVAPVPPRVVNTKQTGRTVEELLLAAQKRLDAAKLAFADAKRRHEKAITNSATVDIRHRARDILTEKRAILEQAQEEVDKLLNQKKDKDESTPSSTGPSGPPPQPSSSYYPNPVHNNSSPFFPADDDSNVTVIPHAIMGETIAEQKQREENIRNARKAEKHIAAERIQKEREATESKGMPTW